VLYRADGEHRAKFGQHHRLRLMGSATFELDPCLCCCCFVYSSPKPIDSGSDRVPRDFRFVLRSHPLGRREHPSSLAIPGRNVEEPVVKQALGHACPARCASRPKPSAFSENAVMSQIGYVAIPAFPIDKLRARRYIGLPRRKRSHWQSVNRQTDKILLRGSESLSDLQLMPTLMMMSGVRGVGNRSRE
jgi:hypothetical protein